MTVRVRQKIQAGVSSTSAEEKDLGNVTFEVVTDGHARGGAWKTIVAATTTNLQLQIDNISTIKFLLIRCKPVSPNDALPTITIKRNSTSGEAQPLVPMATTKESYYMITTDTLTSLYATNAGAVDVELTILAVGD